MKTLVALSEIGREVGYTGQFARQEAARLGIPVAALPVVGRRGRPDLGVRVEHAARLVLALRLRKEYRLRGDRLYTILGVVGLVPDTPRRAGGVVLERVDYLRNWREALTADIRIKLEIKRGR